MVIIYFLFVFFFKLRPKQRNLCEKEETSKEKKNEILNGCSVSTKDCVKKDINI